ncbi:P-LOOP CONTAINING NUCLEOSIDE TRIPHOSPHATE HYDROLASES SUPERFAMILY PROTEIN [Salix viminalis]|uniref:p-LOOP CONTAINING NUCLEOSIDE TRIPHOSPHATE HYDROLASES SUPERFAMILY PROTEIN n=1 Tax=Salix viminalis TaxID=40686 RepID=A0A9Q0Z7L9_SALVM|nr:P-LOOP CONTAINING NUCLEOSIDE TRIPHOSPHATE HYDROLASES SUPERFAMILY PROTEIN [Salix viminalis]
MQLQSGSGSSPTGARLRKKHKRLDAICETVYNQNHSESFNEEKSGPGQVADLELRRSSRVRRAPELLDVSPPPVKKRKKMKKKVDLGVIKSYRNGNSSYRSGNSSSKRVMEEEKDSEGEEDVDDTPGSWRSRLRTRRNAGRGGSSGESRRRKLFDDMEVGESELGEGEGGFDCGKFVVGSKRAGRVKVLSGLESEENKGGNGHGSGNVSENDEGEEAEEDDEMEVVSGEDSDESVLDLGGEIDGGNEEEIGDDDGVQLKGEEEKGRLDGLELERKGDGNENVENVEDDEKVEELVVMDAENERDVDIVNGALVNELEDGQCGTDENKKDDVEIVDLTKGVEERGCCDKNEKDVEEYVDLTKGVEERGCCDKNEKDVEEYVDLTKGVEERGCCDKNEKDVEEYVDLTKQVENKGGLGELEGEKDVQVDKMKRDSTSSLGRSKIKQGRCCGLCGCGNDGKPPKRLVQDGGESENEAYSGSSASEDVKYDVWDGFGDEPEWLGRLLGPINDRYGIAGIWVHQNCAVWSPEVYFAGLGCLKNVRAALCRGKALKCSRCGRPGATIGCRVDRCPKTYHLPCARATGCIFDHRKFLIACTYHRHLFQPYGNQHAMRIKKLKAKKMKLQLRKVSNDAWRKDVEAEEKWLDNCGEDEEFLKRESKRLHRDLLRIAPVYIGGSDADGGKLFEGLGVCCRASECHPMHEGSGKTLVVRALIGSCARGDKRIAYFARKGADCLGKYVGDAERQLRLLFQVAERCQPSIIFFDEIDGLAPCRTRQQDQTHSSVVSTLLALMDGLKSRGSVIVIGATNRPEAVDPALRRPGRFDREIYFPLPSAGDRAAILSLHTRSWPKPVTGSLLKWIARRTVGFAGADLQALCTQAAIIALKRNFPLHEMLAAAGDRPPGAKRIPLPAFAVEERDWLEALACSPPPCSRREAGIAAHDLRRIIYLLIVGGLTLTVSLEKQMLPRKYGGNFSCAGILTGDGICADTDAFADEIDDGSVQFEPSVLGAPDLDRNIFLPAFFIVLLGNVEIQKVDLATVSQEGHGDMVQGITRILMKCASFQSCMIFLPRIDLWAVETCHKVNDDGDASSINHQVYEEKESPLTNSQVVEEENESSIHQCMPTEMTKPQDAARSISPAWSSFVEQVESICMTTSLMIVATSELPSSELPQRIRHFFENNSSNSRHSAPLEHTVPRFSVHIDGNFNHDTVIKYDNQNLCSVDKNEVGTECPHGPLNVPPPPNNRSLKGKSIMLLAISTFGYQVLRYPHFAELCWFTSKLKEGPCADVSGPWKGWPFNSCIIRPCNSLDKVAAACSSGNLKSKERSGVVRGLLAVGLSAYKGEYNSLREVSFEVRKVLELLVEQVNEKIQAGKDRYQYVRLLSQVAYLEDVVNSWAYALQSLEPDAQVKVANAKMKTMEFPGNDTCVDDSAERQCKGETTDINFPETERLEESPKGFPDKIQEGGESNKVENGFCDLNPEDGAILSAEDGSEQHTILCESAKTDNHQNSPADNQLVGNITNEQNGTSHRQSEPEITKNLAVTDGNSETLKHSNGYTLTEPVHYSENGLCNSGELGALKFSDPGSSCNQSNGLAAEGNVDLLSVIRKIDVTEEISNSFKESSDRNPERYDDIPELHSCQCKSSGDSSVVPTECGCHSVFESVNVKASHFARIPVRT